MRSQLLFFSFFFPLRLVLLLCAFAFTVFRLAIGTEAHAAAEPELQRFLKDVTSLSASFEQVQADEKGQTLQTGSGTMALERPGRFRWEQSTPFAQLIVCDGTTVWIHDPDLAQVTKRPAVQVLEGTPAALLAQGRSLDEQFTVEPAGSEGAATRIVRLTPKSADSDFKSIELWLAGGVPSRMRFYDQLGGETNVRFTDVKVNQKIDAARFAFTPPKGTEVIEATAPTKPAKPAKP